MPCFTELDDGKIVTGKIAIFDGKNPWVFGVDFPLNQSIDAGIRKLHDENMVLNVGDKILELGKIKFLLLPDTKISLLVRQHAKKGMAGGKNKIARLVIMTSL